MILEDRKLFFHTTFLIFEDEKVLETFGLSKYSSVVAISRTDFEELSKFKRTKTTSVISLKDSLEDIFRSFNDTTRNEIRKTEKTPDLNFAREDKDTSSIYDLYKKFERAQGRVPFPRSNMKDCIIFSAYFKGELISSIYVDKGGKDLRLRYVFSKRLDVAPGHELYKIISNSTRRLVWEIIIWGKENDFAALDMATVNMTDKDKEGITKFKMSFGGELMPEYTYIYKSKLFSFFERIASLRNKVKKLFQ